MNRTAPALLSLLFLVVLAADTAAGLCTGDCDGDGKVTVDELVLAVNIALDSIPMTECTAIDRNTDDVITADELVAAVNQAVHGCQQEFIPALARKISDPSDLIGGPLAVGRVGDYLLANGVVRVIIRDVGRAFSFGLTYGGNIVDADLVRTDGTPGQDNFGSITPLINIASTVNVQEIVVVNDGTDGEPAVIRTFGVDDLFDAIDPTNAIRGFGAGSLPPSAQDRDIPVRITTEYSLAPGSSVIRIETSIQNDGAERLALYVGDFLNGGGELDTFVPSLGFGSPSFLLEMPYLAYTGTHGAQGLSYGVIPEPLVPGGFPAGGFSQDGITVYAVGQDILGVLLGQAPGALKIPAGETRSYVRHFTVGAGDVGSVSQAYQKLMNRKVGTVTGRVMVEDEPIGGALVAAVRKPGKAGAEFDVVSSFRTDADGRYRGTLPPDDYFLMVKLESHLYDSGTTAPQEHPITVAADSTATQDFEIPAAGVLRVTVVDERDEALPARVTLVGFDPSPDPQNSQKIIAFQVGGFVFNSPHKEKWDILFGISNVSLVGPTGDSGSVTIPPGEYEAFVTRGPEYSLYRERVSITPNQVTTVNAKLVRVVDTTGFVPADFHVHMLNSMDSTTTINERLLSMAAEGVEFFAATDHDFLTDLTNDVSKLQLQDWLQTTVGVEVTTYNLGHYNLWPLQRDPDSITGGAPDWGRSGVAPGMDYPSLGSYDLAPAELFDLAAAKFDDAGEDGVVQVNHINSPTLSFFHLAGIDTALIPPQSFTPPSLIRQDPDLTNLYDDAYDALELWIETNQTQTTQFFDANLGDWFNLLNQGSRKTGTANSDTHSPTIIQSGGPRNFVASPTDIPGEIDRADIAGAILDGRSLGSNAPFVRFTIRGDGGSTAGLELGKPTLVPATSGSATIVLNIQSPEWADFDRVEVYANVVPFPEPDENFNRVKVPRYAVDPTLTLVAPTDFTVETVVVDSEVTGANRHEANLEIPLAVERDTWVVLVVRGTHGVSRPLWPMNPQDIEQESNTTLEDLVDGNLGEGGETALAFTNPLFIDYDGNGRFDPSMEMPGNGE